MDSKLYFKNPTMSGELPLWKDQQTLNPEFEAKNAIISSLTSRIQDYSLPLSVNSFLTEQIAQLNKTTTEKLNWKVELIEQSAKKFGDLEQLFSWNSWFELFGVQLLNLNQSSKVSILNMLVDENFVEITKYIKINWIPTNELMFAEFWKAFEYKLNFVSLQEREKTAISNIDNANIETLTKIYHALSGRLEQSTELFSMLKQIADWWDKKAYKELIPYLKANPEELKILIVAVQKLDAEQGTNYYQELRHTLITADPLFLGIMDELAAASSWNERKITFNQAYIASLSGDNPKLKGHFLESTNKYGDTISIDTKQIPPLRELTLAWSEYALEASTFIGVLHKPEAKFAQELTRLDKQLVVLNALQNDSILNHIMDLGDHGYSLDEIKHQFEVVYKIDISFIDSMSDLRSQVSLKNKEWDIEKKIKLVENQYKQALRDAIKPHREAMLERDEQTREILQFLSNTCFDLIPKQYTDQLISEIKSWMIIVKQFNLDPARLDLKNGRFWESATEADWIQWKKKLLKFFNMMISWSPDNPILIESHISSGGKTEDKTAMKYLFKSSGLITESWSFNIEKARENLSKET